MTNSEIILQKVDSFYTPRHSKIKLPYEHLCSNHLKMIEILNDFWIDRKIKTPKNKEPVICIEDLTSIGKGKFVSDYFYEKKHFVANLGADDPYGFVTHWISVKRLNESTIDFEQIILNNVWISL